MTINILLTFLGTHQYLTLLTLFLGAYFETLIITSFLVYGEFFFLAGAILAGMGQASLWQVSLVLYLGGFLGDHSSYWIGRKWGTKLYLFFQTVPFFRRYFTQKNYTQGETFFDRYGGQSVFLGRFLGPVSWITPFIAGTFRIRYSRFTLFDFPAVILGIGQFLIVGYIFGDNYKAILAITEQYLLLFIIVVIIAVLLYLKRKKFRSVSTFGENTISHLYKYLHMCYIWCKEKGVLGATIILLLLLLYIILYNPFTI